MAVTFRNEKIFCTNCGQEQVVPFPIQIPILSAMTKAFEKMHKKCKGIWKQPEPDMTLPLTHRMYWWLDNGERGISSETMFQCLSGKIISNDKGCHPHDPDDFKRCYMLLKAIPEWKNDLYKLKDLSMEWNNLVDNWDKLTEMLEEQLSSKQDNGMYELMEKLIKNTDI
jgi:hypothetical protein